MSTHPWLADRTAKFDSSGIRKVFDLAAKMKNPINLSIGQPDFPVPDAIKEAAIAAIRGDKNGYSVTQGIARAARAAASSKSTSNTTTPIAACWSLPARAARSCLPCWRWSIRATK